MRSIHSQIEQIMPEVQAYEARQQVDYPSAEELKLSLRKFITYFYPLLMGRKYVFRPAISRKSFFDSIEPVLDLTTRPMEMGSPRVLITCPPRYGKTLLIIMYIAWAMAKHPHSSFIYVSYSAGLSVTQTRIVKKIISLREYGDIFGIGVSSDSKAAGNFETTTGGLVYGVGINGEITGRGAGISDITEYGGAILIDDPHKPHEVPSDVIREKTIEWYTDTLLSRVNNPKYTPIIAIGQRVHEYDLQSHLMLGDIDHFPYNHVNLPALDRVNNPLMPDMHDKEMLMQMKEKSPYNFASQYQQDPSPAGGALFQETDFPIMDAIPKMEYTFITADTAETDKTYNDASVFSFWGLYKIQIQGEETGAWALHWLDCEELRVEPKDLEGRFLDFYRSCLMFPVKPSSIGIEKKSTGTWLLSILKGMPGVRVFDTTDYRESKTSSKSTRFVQAQPYIAGKKISFTIDMKHVPMCIKHMSKISANDSHRWDDIADTCIDAIQLGLVTEVIQKTGISTNKKPEAIPGYSVPKRQFKTWNR